MNRNQILGVFWLIFAIIVAIFDYRNINWFFFTLGISIVYQIAGTIVNEIQKLKQ